MYIAVFFLFEECGVFGEVLFGRVFEYKQAARAQDLFIAQNFVRYAFEVGDVVGWVGEYQVELFCTDINEVEYVVADYVSPRYIKIFYIRFNKVGMERVHLYGYNVLATARGKFVGYAACA